MSHPRRAIAIAIGVIAALLATVSMAAAAPGLQATLSPTASPGTVRLSLVNTGATPAQVPTWLTGAHGVVDPILEVTHDGVAAEYTGMLAKHRDPIAADMVTVPPGGSASWTLDVATAYALPAAGVYAVRYRATLRDGQVLESAMAAMEVATPTPEPVRVAPRDLDALAVAYTGCTNAEQTQLTTALSAADDYARNAVAAFAAARQGARYVTWFGTYASGRWSAVQAHYTAIQGVTGGGVAAFDCTNAGCAAGVYAYVYPGTPYVIHPCGEFWNSQVTGTDSRAGTLIHEISHFTVVAGTADHVYGQSGAMALAISNPEQAKMNADNHEYFAENNPPQEYATYSASRTTIDFGTVATGGTATASITLTSAGDIPVQLTSIVAPPGFTRTATTCLAGPLAPAATCTIDLAYSPVAVGGVSGTLSIQGNMDVTPQAVTLTGTATTSVPASDPGASQAPVVTPAPDPTPVAQAPDALPAQSAPAARLAGAASCASGSCAVRGTLPAGARRVAVSAARKGSARTVRGTCTVTRRAGRATYSCGITLPKGTWSVTTQAVGASGVVATSTVSKTVR